MQNIFSSLNFIQLVPVNRSKFYSLHHKSHYRKCNDHIRGKKVQFLSQKKKKKTKSNLVFLIVYFLLEVLPMNSLNVTEEEIQKSL